MSKAMAKAKTVEHAGDLVDPSWKSLYTIGGICMIGVGLVFSLGTLFAIVTMGTPPETSQAVFDTFSSKSTLAFILYGLFALSDFLLLPTALALNRSLKKVNKGAMLLATGLLLLYLLADMVVEFNWLALNTLVQNHVINGTEAQRAVYAAVVDYALALIPICLVTTLITGGLSMLITNLVMLKGPFNKYVAYLGIFVGIVMLIATFYVLVPALTSLIVIYIVWGVWACITGFSLYSLGRAQDKQAKTA